MSLLYIDGFGHQNMKRYVSANGGGFAGNSGGRIPGCYYLQGYYNFSGINMAKSIPATTEIFVGVGYKTADNGNSPAQQIQLWGDNFSTQHLTIFCNSTRKITVQRGGTTIATGTTDLGNNLWHYVEVRATISDTVGICQVRLDGQTVNEINYTGDTRNGGTAQSIDTVRLVVISYPNGPYGGMSDWYIADTNGTTNNTWLGDIAVRTMTPNANGTYSQLTNSAGNQTNNYSYVDEVPASSTDYVSSQTIGQKDTYAMSDVPAGVTKVYGVQVNTTAKKSDVNLAQLKTKFISGGVEYTGTTHALSTSAQEYSDLYDTDPTTGAAWTVTNVNAIETGAEVA